MSTKTRTLYFLLCALFILGVHSSHAAPSWIGKNQTCLLNIPGKKLVVIDHTQDVMITLPLPSEPRHVNMDGDHTYVLTKDELICFNTHKFNQEWSLPNQLRLNKMLIHDDTLYFTSYDPNYLGLHKIGIPQLRSYEFERSVTLLKPTSLKEFLIHNGYLYFICNENMTLYKISLNQGEPIRAMGLCHFPMMLSLCDKFLLILYKDKSTIGMVSLTDFNLSDSIDLPFIPESLVYFDQIIYCVEAPTITSSTNSYTFSYTPRRLAALHLKTKQVLATTSCKDTQGLTPLISLTPRHVYGNQTPLMKTLTAQREQDLRQQLVTGEIWIDLNDTFIDLSKSQLSMPKADAIISDTLWDEHGSILRMLRHLREKEKQHALKDFELALEANCPYARAIAYIAHTYGVFGYVMNDALALFYLSGADQKTIDNFKRHFFFYY